MKVLHLIPSIGPVRGGPSHAIVAMVRTLRDSGVDARIVCTDDNGEHRLDVPLGEWTRWEGVPVQFFPHWQAPVGTVRGFAISGALTRWLWKNLREYDLLHCHALFSYPSTTGMTVARKLEVPYILRTIGQLGTWSMRQGALRKQAYLALIEGRNIKGAAALHFTSRAEKEEAEAQLGSHPSFVLPLGVELPTIRTREESRAALRRFVPRVGEDPVLVFLSRLHPKKRLETLLDALSDCMELKWQLLVAGDGEAEYVQGLRARAHRAGVDERCHWLGFVEGERKREVLAGADWFVLPSASENFGIAVAEALANGTPAILSPGVAIAEDVKAAKAGVMADSSREDTASAIRRLLAESEQWPGYRESARRLAETSFAWTAIGRRLLEEYQRCAHDNATSLRATADRRLGFRRRFFFFSKLHSR